MVLTRRTSDDISWQSNETDTSLDSSAASPTLMYRPPVVEWKEYAEKKIHSLALLSEEDWDDKGSAAIGPKAISNTMSLFFYLIKKLNLPKPNIVPGYKGEVIVLWARNGYEVRIWISNDGRFKYTEKSLSSNKTLDFGWGNLATCLSIADLSLVKIY